MGQDQPEKVLKRKQRNGVPEGLVKRGGNRTEFCRGIKT